ncbi:unnamed protein product [Caenorhabditis bovis]|uniref:G-protein coupled receptors family 1 profile domain-containing protein n=1 Tax=Caenorhabditis bovis TaxID=2654633 RepID=A0A8S1EBL7_9PELO|nr:unnamed protein product [Caenorhabditis bovis]
MQDYQIQKLTAIFYPVYTGLVIILQTTLLFLIFKNQAKLLVNLRLYLVHICTTQLITLISGFLTQCRMVPNVTTVAFICNGMCTNIGRKSCFIVHLLRDASSTANLFALVHVFYYRYTILSHKSINRFQLYRNMIIIHLPAVFCAICQFINPSNQDIILEETRKFHPDYMIDENSIFGFSELNSWSVKMMTIIFPCVLVLNPIAAFIYRRKICTLLKEYEEYSASRVQNAKSMIKGLMVQTLLPPICFIPLFAEFFLFSKYPSANLALLEYLNSFLVILPTMLDPILSIYFVIPFRRKFIKYVISIRQCKRMSLSSDDASRIKQITGNKKSNVFHEM